jgi:1,6-anhydro-N-acetylmuramate kinase
VNEALLAEFLDYKYYKQESLPIGVGAEDFPEKLFQSWHAKAKEMGVKDIDLLTTLTELTAKQIALSCAKFGGPHIANGATDDVILRGGISNNRCV